MNDEIEFSRSQCMLTNPWDHSHMWDPCRNRPTRPIARIILVTNNIYVISIFLRGVYISLPIKARKNLTFPFQNRKHKSVEGSYPHFGATWSS